MFTCPLFGLSPSWDLDSVGFNPFSLFSCLAPLLHSVFSRIVEDLSLGRFCGATVATGFELFVWWFPVDVVDCVTALAVDDAAAGLRIVFC